MAIETKKPEPEIGHALQPSSLPEYVPRVDPKGVEVRLISDAIVGVLQRRLEEVDQQAASGSAMRRCVIGTQN